MTGPDTTLATDAENGRGPSAPDAAAPDRCAAGDPTPIETEAARLSSAWLGAGMPPMRGDFRPKACLGAGSYGEVWLAGEYVGEVAFRDVAVKFLLDDREEAKQALRQEAKRLDSLAGLPGIVHIHDLVIDGERPYFTMDYVAGGSLARRIERAGGKLPAAEALAIFRSMAEALEAVHLRGIIHCDLKPENVLLGEDDRPRLADFGQAQLKGQGPLNTGSWFYMPPEQVDPGSTTPGETSCDVYALGSILYKMLTGVEPRAEAGAVASVEAARSLREKLQAHHRWLLDAPRPSAHRDVPGVDRPLAAIIDRCLEVDPGLRFRDGSDVRAALEQREVILRRGPWLRRGLAATAAAMIGLFLLLHFGVSRVLDRFRATLIEESFRRDSVSAHLAGDVVEDILLDSKALVAHWARSGGIREAVARKDKARLCQAVDEMLQNRTELRGDSSFRIHSVTAYDTQGYRIGIVRPDLARAPGDNGPPDPLDTMLWNWRAWFNGLDRDQVPRAEPFPPLDSPRISPPYVWYGTESEVGNGLRVVTFSAPIREGPGEDSGAVLGVLNLSIDVRSLYPWLRDLSLSNHGLIIAIVDDGGHCVWHETLEKLKGQDVDGLVDPGRPTRFPFLEGGSVVLRPPPDGRMHISTPRVFPAYAGLIAAARAKGVANPGGKPGEATPANPVTLDDFVDPIDTRHYLATFSLLPRTGWGVIVEHEREEALDKIDSPGDHIRWMIWAGYAGTLAIVVVLWSAILRRHRREEQFAHA